MTRPTSIEALRESPLLEGLPDALLEALVADSEPVELVDDEILMDEGSPATAMYVVLEGTLEARKHAESGAQVSLGTLGPGELVGELALVHGSGRTAQLRARGPARLLAIRAEAFDDVLAHPGVARVVLATATKRLSNQEVLLRQHGRMVALGTLTAGLLHELNNPAAALRRAVDHLGTALTTMDDASAVLATAASPTLQTRLAEAVATRSRGGGSDAGPLARADAEDRLRAHLAQRSVPRPWDHAGLLVEAGLDVQDVDSLLDGVEGEVAGTALGWLAARTTVQRLLDEAATGAARIADVVGAVKAYSHQGEAAAQDVVIHDGLEAALTLLRHKIPAGMQVVRRYAPDLPTVEGHPGDLNGVWTNLLDNAIDAAGEHGTIEVTTSHDDDQVVVAIIDDGPGIPPQMCERLFDPFFTTKPVGAGTGLGLATAQTVVTQRHGGWIDVESQPGRTAMTVTLPRFSRAHGSFGTPAPDDKEG